LARNKRFLKTYFGELATIIGTGAYWYYLKDVGATKIFETQKQCLEYCMDQEQI